MNNESIEQVRELISPALEQCGVEFVSAEWAGGKRGGVLRLFIDKPNGVSIGDCERVSRIVTDVLDTYEPIAGDYSLEVSSPGAERPVTTHAEWAAALGRRVNVRYQSGTGETVLEGRVLGVETDQVELEVRLGRNRKAIAIVPLAELIAAHIVVDI